MGTESPKAARNLITLVPRLPYHYEFDHNESSVLRKVLRR